MVPSITALLLDNESGAGEEWVTMGRDAANQLLVVVDTYVELSAEREAVRIISARRSTRREVRCRRPGDG